MDSRPRTANELLRRQREIRGWSQRRVASEVGTTEKRVSAWELGESTPSPHYQELLCTLFDKDVEGLGFIRVRSPETPIPATAQGADGSHTGWLDQAETIVNLSWELWFASRSERAAQEIFKLLPRLHLIKTESISLIHQLRAQHLAVRCHGLLGAIYLDMIQNDTAMYHFEGARRMAAEIYDMDQTATYLAQIGNVLQHKGDKLAAINRMELARDQALQASHATRGHILQQLAYAYADAGREGSFEHAISEATSLLSYAGEGIDSVRYEFIPFGAYVTQGSAYRSLGKPLAAIPYLGDAEKSLVCKPVAPRWNALLQICKAQAFCDAGDLDVGVALAKHGLLLSDACQSPQQMNCVKKLLRELESSEHKNDRRVGDLRELLHETYVRRG